tara:strand:+ start:431 stop:544 length:114 start_codon:yes stop_codon:yes gene_type:complete
MNEEQAKAYLKWMAKRKAVKGTKFEKLLKTTKGDEEE